MNRAMEMMELEFKDRMAARDVFIRDLEEKLSGANNLVNGLMTEVAEVRLDNYKTEENLKLAVDEIKRWAGVGDVYAKETLKKIEGV